MGTKKIIVFLASFAVAGTCPFAGAQNAPPTSCQEKCGLLKEELLRKCTADDGTTDAACVAQVESEVTRCLQACDGQPPPEPTCQDHCAALALDLKTRCVRPDGSVDEACLQEYLATVEACYAACGGQPPPPPATCQERCALLEKDLLQGCLDATNGNVDSECLEKVKLTVARCLEGCDGQPPPEPTCRDSCDALALDLKLKCIGADGTVDEACVQEYLATVEACYAACGGQPPPPPATCQERCALLEQDLLQGCLDATNGDVDAECLEKVKLTVARCLEGCDGQPPGEPTCRDRCDALASDLKVKCVRSDGTVDEACLQDNLSALLACYAACGDQPPPPPIGCQEKCSLLKLELLTKCVSPDGTVDAACLEEIEQTVMRCLGNCVEPPPPQPACRERCDALASDLKLRCILAAEGTVDEACLAEAARTVEGCYAACESPPPPPEPGCDESCRAVAEAILAGCREQGVPGDGCRARAEEALKACLAEKCPPAPPQPTNCREKCERHSREVFDLCLKDGNTPEACEEKSAEAFRRCATECTPDDDANSAEPVPCDQDCVSQSEGLFKTCVAAGGSEDECRARSDAILGLCLERCSGEVPCENRCALAAQLVLVGSSLAGLSAEESRRIANEVLERCVEGCKPGDSCPDRCQALAATAVRECIARGGSDEECQAKGAEVQGSCDQQCRGDAVPPCDVQCDEKAAAMVNEWVAQGMGPDEVAARRDRFLEECRKLLGNSCVEDAKAGLTAFRGFRRGDANRDGSFDITDPIAIMAWLFQGGPAPACEDAADANDDGWIDLSDPVVALGTLFQGAAPLPDPYDRTGQDPTSDALICAE